MKGRWALLVSITLVFGTLHSTAIGEVVIDGGGWGHGVGMSQFGAKALAEQGEQVDEIIAHFYSGTSLGTVGQGAVTGHAEPLYVGVGQNMSTVAFNPVGGSVQLCLGGVCSYEAAPLTGQKYWFRVHEDGIGCGFFLDEVPIGPPPGPCDGQIQWGNQPTTRVFVESPVTRTYARGSIRFKPALNGRFHLVVEVGLQNYLYGLGEMPSSWHIEALKAQAIAGRSYAVSRAYTWRNLSSSISRQNACWCHLYGSTMDQAYVGWAKEAEGLDPDANGYGHWGERWRSAVDATAGRVITHTSTSGRAITANYFSSTGGRTENNEDVWGQTPIAYLRSVADPGATAWVRRFNDGAFAAALGFSSVSRAEIVSTYSSGSPKEIRVTGLVGSSQVTKSYTGSQLKVALSGTPSLDGAGNPQMGLRAHWVFEIDGLLPNTFTWMEVGDFDDNGRDDIVGYDQKTGEWWIGRSTGSGFQFSKWGEFGTSTGWKAFLVGDFSGDGRSDVAAYHEGTGRWWIGRSTGSGFSFQIWSTFGTKTGWSAHLAGDFDGDGRDDLASYHPGNGSWWVQRSTGSGFTVSRWAAFSTKTGWTNQVVGDFNGDGKADVANYHPTNGTWWVSRSTGSGFATSLWATFSTKTGWSSPLVGDFNNDGRDDVANHHSSNNTWWISRSTGSSFGTTLFGTTTGTTRLMGDATGDGRDDVIVYNSSNGRWQVGVSNGSAFSVGTWAAFSTKSGWSPQLAGDFNGDGDHDVASYFSGNGTWWVVISNGSSFTVASWK